MKLDYTNVMAAQIGVEHGLTDADFDSLNTRATAAHAHLAQLRTSKQIGFFELPHDQALLTEIQEFAERQKGRFDDVVVLGIGGSALGLIGLRTALAHPHRRVIDGFPRLHVLDNVDPDFVTSISDVIDVKKTLFIVITKSGGTAETMSQFLYFRQILIDVMGDEWTKNMVAITDSSQGNLRRIVDDDGLTDFTIPDNVGGRFSVLTPVGLLPAALAGYDIAALMRGAADMDNACHSPEIRKNPAYLYAAIHYLLDQKGKPISVMMPYSNRLKDAADWYCQLWAESIGKRFSRDREEIFVGQTPVKALGATDQHSQVQLYVEGPFDKIVVFIRVENFNRDGEFPTAYKNLPGVSYLGGHSFAELINAEQSATAIALTNANRPNLTISFPQVDAYAMGQLFQLLEMATAYAGELYHINPFDQPGVEAGKIATYALMGREGYETERKRIEQAWASRQVRVLEV